MAPCVIIGERDRRACRRDSALRAQDVSPRLGPYRVSVDVRSRPGYSGKEPLKFVARVGGFLGEVDAETEHSTWSSER
jgi:hypothetical protein